MFLASIAILAGCATPGDAELLESQLRLQDDTISQLQLQLSSATDELKVAHAESTALRDQLAERGSLASVLPEQADVLYRVHGVRLHKFFTGGVNKDDQPGDEAISVLLVPHDKDGTLLKLPGGVHIDIFDMALPPDRQKIGSWDFTDEETRSAWHVGFFGSGFLLELPWKEIPVSPTLTVHARLLTTDGRDFHTTKQVQITPPGAADIAVTPRSPMTEPPRLIPTAGLEMAHPFDDEEDDAPTLSAEADDHQPGFTETSDRWKEHTRPTWR